MSRNNQPGTHLGPGAASENVLSCSERVLPHGFAGQTAGASAEPFNKQRLTWLLFAAVVALLLPFYQHVFYFLGYGGARIRYYGIIRDQDHHPVAGARVEATAYAHPLINIPFAGGDIVRRVHAESNTLGRFTIDGGIGYGLNWNEPMRRGYLIATPSPSFLHFTVRTAPGAFRPNPRRPVLIPAWRMGPKPRLLHWGGDIFFRKPSATTLDLLRCSQRSGRRDVGDLVVAVTAPPRPLALKKCFFAVRISVLDGGLQRTQAVFPFKAPKAGYRKMVLLYVFYNPPLPAVPRGTFALGGDMPALFYVSLLNGRAFGVLRIHPQTTAFNNGGRVGYGIYLNCAGSRNVQLYKCKEIKPNNKKYTRTVLKKLVEARGRH